MKRYVLERLMWLIIIVIAVAVLIFTVLYFVPGDPVELMLGDNAPPEQIEYQRELLGLNDPYFVQLGRFLYNTFIRFDLGTSITMKIDIAKEVGLRLPRTLGLAFLCVAMNIIVGVPLGITAATHRGKFRDTGLMVFSTIGISIPNFWLAILLIMLFAVKLRWLPLQGIGGVANWVLPVIAGSIEGIAYCARQTRSSVLETIRADYISTARSKGLKERTVIYKHMLPNAMIPIIHTFTERFTRSISGMVVIETIFSFPGLGMLMVQGIQYRDYPVVRVCVLILAVLNTLIVLFADLMYAFIDPRIKAQYVNSSAKKKKMKGVTEG